MPSSGLVSRAGVIPNSFTFDHCGPMARTVEDCAILLQIIAGYDTHDAGSIPHEIPDYRAALTGDIKGLRIGVLRHYWEKDMPAHPDLGRAMDAAIAVFTTLGARVEDCETRPMQDSFDTKVIIAESEIYSIHYDNLKSRPGDFGRDFLGRVLPACLFQSSDYVQAAREHRRIIAAVQPLYEKYDVVLAAGFGPAPRLDSHRTVNFWQKTNVFTPSNVFGGPSLALPNGMSGALPLGMQLIGRPFDEPTVLRAGHAYQLATDWHMRHPTLAPERRSPSCSPKATSRSPLTWTRKDATSFYVRRSVRDLSSMICKPQYCSRPRRLPSRWPNAYGNRAAAWKSRRSCFAFPADSAWLRPWCELQGS